MRLFVYGSLKNGHSAHSFVSKWSPTFLGKKRTTPEYHIYRITWYPGMVKDESVQGQGVEGEVYDIADECLVDMDRYEGCDGDEGLFRREEITLQDSSTAIAYLFNLSFNGKSRIEDGVWTDD